MKYTLCKLWFTSLLLAGCGSGASSRAQIDDSRRPPPPPAPPAAVAPTPSDPKSGSAPASDPEQAKPPGGDESAPAPPSAPGYPAAVLIGARVDNVRTDPAEIVIQVGDSVALGEDLFLVAYDARDQPVRGVVVRPALESRFAVLEGGYLRGLAEGTTELRMAIRAPPASGTGPPEVRIFSAPVAVVGRPVARVEIADAGLRLLVGTVVGLKARAYTAAGDLRTSFAVEWRSSRPDLVTVDERGFVRALQSGAATVYATAEGVEGRLTLEVDESPVAAFEVTGPAQGRTGDVLHYRVVALDADGNEVEGVAAHYSVAAVGEGARHAALIYQDGGFVAERVGLYRVVATVGGRSGEIIVEAVARGVGEDARVVGRGVVPDRPTADLWAFTGTDGRDYVYAGTRSERMVAWEVTNPANPTLTDFVEVDARAVADVAVNAAGTFAAITREGASDGENGIVILDLADPAHPVVADDYTKGLKEGATKVLFADTLLYVVPAGSPDLHILDASRPTDIEEVARWGIERPGARLSDLRVAGGLAYLAYGPDGVHILDVGDRRWGGTPTEPVAVGSYTHPEGSSRVSLPYRSADGHSYLFVVEETPACDACASGAGRRGHRSHAFVRVLDIGDPTAPRAVARYEVPEAAARSLWVEGDRLYIAYGRAGLRVVDISGELRGDLYRQGREVARVPTGDPDGHTANSPMAMGVQSHRGAIVVSDRNSGLWAVELDPPGAAGVGP